MKHLPRKHHAEKDQSTGLFVSKGKIKFKPPPAPIGESEQRKRQEADDDIRRRAGQRSEYLHETTLSKPFGKAGKSARRWEKPDKELRRKLYEEKQARQKRYWDPNKKIKTLRQPLGDLRIQILARDRYACRYCGTRIGPFHVDHVLAWSKGGTDTPENLVTSCERCNLRKGIKNWIPVTLEKHLSLIGEAVITSTCQVEIGSSTLP